MLRFSEAFCVSSQHYDGYKCGASPKLHTSIPQASERRKVCSSKKTTQKSPKPRRGARFVADDNDPQNPPSLGEAQGL
ncbi:MAG: hypothetical protein ACK4GN_16390 [Runella sp.]